MSILKIVTSVCIITPTLPHNKNPTQSNNTAIKKENG